MIYTVTMNPSLDYTVEADKFCVGMTNRTKSESILPGGKGINISIVLNNLGIDSMILGFLAGFTGDELKNKLTQIGLKHEFIEVKEGFTRINVKLKSIDGTEINGMGPKIDENDIEALLDKLSCCKKGDIVFLAGSVPLGVSDEIYMDICTKMERKEVLVVVDATKNLLKNTLQYHPFLIKPNKQELEEIFGVSITNKQEVVTFAKKLRQMGARNVLVSLSKEGSVFVCENGNVMSMPAHKGKLVNAVGAGDSMVAGFIAGLLEKQDYEYAYKFAAAAASASAFSENLATKEGIKAFI